MLKLEELISTKKGPECALAHLSIGNNFSFQIREFEGDGILATSGAFRVQKMVDPDKKGASLTAWGSNRSFVADLEWNQI